MTDGDSMFAWRNQTNYVDALIYIEDKRFYDHWGVDPYAVFRAIAQNLRAGRIESGASTITMQLIRTLEPRRTFLSKVIGIFSRHSARMVFRKYENTRGIFDLYTLWKKY